MRERTFWLIGDWKGREFAEVADWLEKRGRCCNFESIAAAAYSKKPSVTPGAMVIAQSRPGQVAGDAIESLAALHPASATVLLNGPWCEGEHRAGQVICGVVRVPWRRWRSGLDKAIEQVAAGPDLGDELAKIGHKKRVPARAAVWAYRRASYLYLADALAQMQMEPVWLGGSGCHTAAADLILYDGWEYVMPIPFRPALRPQGRLARRRAPRSAIPPPRVVLLNFPRPDDALAASAWGIDAVLPQPFLLADLSNTLDRLVERDKTPLVIGDNQ